MPRLAGSLCGLCMLAWLCAGSALAAPKRVVSINVCTDQLAMLVAGPEQLLAVSHLARDPHSSAMVEAANRYPVTDGGAEAVFQLRPDLVLAGAYTTPETVRLLQRLGVAVERFGAAVTMADIAGNLRRMGGLLGRQEKAEALARAVEQRLDALKRAPGATLRTVFLDANAYTAGRGTLVHAMIEGAGLRNIAAEHGLAYTARLPLEAFVLARPQLVLLPQRYSAPSMSEAVLDHPAVRAVASKARRLEMPGAAATCGTPATLAMVETMAAARQVSDD